MIRKTDGGITYRSRPQGDIAALERLARTYIKRLSDWQRPLSYDHAAQLYRRIWQYEGAFGRPEGKEGRLAKLAQAFVDYEKRWAVSQTLALLSNRSAELRSAAPRQGERPHSIAPGLRRWDSGKPAGAFFRGCPTLDSGAGQNASVSL
jgi:hypothetical protein